MLKIERIDAGIVVAMQVEARHLIAAADEHHQIDAGIYPTWRIRIGNSDAIVTQSGIGMVRSAAATQLLISTWKPAIVGNFGCAGAHVEEMNPGDVVVGDRSVAHYNIQIGPDGAERYVGFTTESGEDIAHADDSNSIASDPELVEHAIKAISEDSIEAWPGAAAQPQWRVGAVGSADVWTQQLSRLAAIHGQHGTLCEDMEAAAIAKIASLHGIPFVTVKDISNNEFHAATDLTDFSEFPVGEAGKRSARVVAGVLGRLQPGRV